MQKLLPSTLVCLLWCGLSHGQLTNVSVDQISHDGSIPSLTGQTTYRVFVNTVSGTDFVTSISGNVEYPLNFSTSTNFYRSDAHFSELLSGINSSLIENFGLEDLRYSSGVTIGQISDTKLGTPITSENPLGEIAGNGATTSIPDPAANWIPQFTAGGNIEINTFTGGAWVALNGGFNQSSSLNGYGTGVNNSVLIGQFTTDGEFSFNFSPLILENLPDPAANNIPHEYIRNENEGLGLSYPSSEFSGLDTEVSFDLLDEGLFIGNIFPNPVIYKSQINYGEANTCHVTLDILDINGSLVQTIFSGSAEAGVTYQQMFETAGIESGVYMVRLTGNNGSRFQRVVVAK